MVTKKLSSPTGPRIGVDENGLGPLLGPLVVTAVLADVDEQGAKRMSRALPQSLRKDLDDSKALVSNRKVALAEAWARATIEFTTGTRPQSVDELLRTLSRQTDAQLRRDCPPSTEPQCFSSERDEFVAEDAEVVRISKVLGRLEKIGIVVQAASTEIVCTGRLNELKEQGVHRFAADLHSMERLVLHLREVAERPVVATCGKVGGITKYEPFWGPLSGRLFTALEEQRARSCYHFPQLGELRFVRDADASDPLVMLASLIGKYVREAYMRRIARFYEGETDERCAEPSGYHDPLTRQFVEQTRARRRSLRIVDSCFQRRGAD